MNLKSMHKNSNMVKTAYNILEEIFTSQINVLNVAVPTEPVNHGTVRDLCMSKNYDFHLVKEPDQEDLLVYEKNSDIVRPLNDSEVISESTPLLDVIEILCKKDHVFVKVKRNVTHLVTRADLDSIPVRIWLYGMISLFEIEIKEMIRKAGVNWEELMSQSRIDSAMSLYKHKAERNEEIDLLGCTQLVDIGTILFKRWQDYSNLFPDGYSKNSARNCFCDINSLRDALAHGQKLTMEWSKIHSLMVVVSNILARI